MLKMFAQEKATFNGKRTLLIICLVLLGTFAITSMLPTDVSDYGIWSIYPAIFLVIYIFATKRILEALVLASLVGFVMVSRPSTMGGEGNWIVNTFSNFSEGLTNVMMDEDIAWLKIGRHTSELQSHLNLVCRLLLDHRNGICQNRVFLR